MTPPRHRILLAALVLLCAACRSAPPAAEPPLPEPGVVSPRAVH